MGVPLSGQELFLELKKGVVTCTDIIDGNARKTVSVDPHAWICTLFSLRSSPLATCSVMRRGRFRACFAFWNCPP